jgi:hypothetical protein
LSIVKHHIERIIYVLTREKKIVIAHQKELLKFVF